MEPTPINQTLFKTTLTSPKTAMISMTAHINQIHQVSAVWVVHKPSKIPKIQTRFTTSHQIIIYKKTTK
jgi:hypothetical protein